MPPLNEMVTLPARDLLLGLVAVYNRGIWPAQLFGVALALGAVAFVLVKPGLLADICAKVVLDLFWLWLGATFFIVHVGPTFGAGYIFAAAFIVQGTLFVGDAFYGTLEFRPYAKPSALFVGLALIAVAVVLYPLVASALGRGWPRLSLVGTAAGPTAAFTLGFLLFTVRKPKPWFFVIPAAWALAAGIGVAAAWHYYEELIIAAAAAIAVVSFVATAGAGRGRRTADNPTA